MINKQITKDNFIFDIPFNSERKTTKIFKMGKIKTDISPNRSNNLSCLNTRNESSKNNYKYKNINNMNSYAKIAKNRNYISPTLKHKNKKYINHSIKTNEYDEIFNKYYENSNHNYSLNSININLNNTSVNNAHKRKDIIKIDNLNNDIDKHNICDGKKRKNSNLLNKIEKSSSKGYKDKDEDDLNKTIDINDEEFNDDGIKDIKNKDKKDIKNNKDIKEININNNINNNINKKQNKSKFAEIFLFDNNEEEKLNDKNKE